MKAPLRDNKLSKPDHTCVKKLILIKLFDILERQKNLCHRNKNNTAIWKCFKIIMLNSQICRVDIRMHKIKSQINKADKGSSTWEWSTGKYDKKPTENSKNENCNP